eukprot:TRINITY_DN5822_c0_g2_i5.p1 TRINITY_DN5822_c0_g2~~TRINITY_DN5822_c0_g2_i5.p1  ORF type:complete len:160 (-),score=17.27 TRINITY_DN5822_c0_g2_i5:30-509(-)
MLADVELRAEWDSNIVKVELLEKPESHLAVYHYIFRNPSLFYKDREFLDKCLVFQDSMSRDFYAYMTSVPNTIAALNPNCIRGKNLFSLYHIHVNPKRNIVITLSYQMDFKFAENDQMLYIEYAHQLEYFIVELITQLNKTASVNFCIEGFCILYRELR